MHNGQEVFGELELNFAELSFEDIDHHMCERRAQIVTALDHSFFVLSNFPHHVIKRYYRINSLIKIAILEVLDVLHDEIDLFF